MSVLRRLDASKRLIADFIELRRAPYVSISWGKDSMLMLWLVREVNPSIPCLWFDGGQYDEWPETYPFMRRVVDSWSLDLTVVYPETSLSDQWREYGVPWKLGDPADRAYAREFDRSLKAEAHRRGWDGQFVGMRAQESPNRKLLLYSRGPVYFGKGRRLWTCCPLWNWDVGDLWLATDMAGIPVHPIYSMDPTRPRHTVRLGVMAESCLQGQHGALTVFRRRHPSMFNALADQFPELRGRV